MSTVILWFIPDILTTAALKCIRLRACWLIHKVVINNELQRPSFPPQLHYSLMRRDCHCRHILFTVNNLLILLQSSIAAVDFSFSCCVMNKTSSNGVRNSDFVKLLLTCNSSTHTILTYFSWSRHPNTKTWKTDVRKHSVSTPSSNDPHPEEGPVQCSATAHVWQLTDSWWKDVQPKLPH